MPGTRPMKAMRPSPAECQAAPCTSMKAGTTLPLRPTHSVGKVSSVTDITSRPIEAPAAPSPTAPQVTPGEGTPDDGNHAAQAVVSSSGR